MKKKCPRCDRKNDNKFSFCPHCGIQLKLKIKNNDFGMLGKDDYLQNMQDQIKMPFGMEKIMGSLIKQLEKQMGSIDLNGMPKGIKIQIARAPNNQQSQTNEKLKSQNNMFKASEKEIKRRLGLQKIIVESRVKRLGDTIIYEMETPGIKRREDVIITELATGFEMKAYSSDKCYVKFIPLKTDEMEYYVEKDKVLIELKN